MRKISIKLSDGSTQIITVSEKSTLTEREIERNLFGNSLVCSCSDRGIYIDARFK